MLVVHCLIHYAKSNSFFHKKQITLRCSFLLVNIPQMQMNNNKIRLPPGRYSWLTAAAYHVLQWFYLGQSYFRSSYSFPYFPLCLYTKFHHTNTKIDQMIITISFSLDVSLYIPCARKIGINL